MILKPFDDSYDFAYDLYVSPFPTATHRVHANKQITPVGDRRSFFRLNQM
jgi:hypothetical protein